MPIHQHKEHAVLAEPPIIMDLEASGFGQNSYPIEIGIALPSGQTACRLIRPAAGWTHWSDESERLHGIQREQLFNYGYPVTEVADWVNSLLKGKTVYSDGWAFDQGWLNLLFDSAQRRPQFRLQALQILFDAQDFEVWNRTKDRVLEKTNYKRHRASNDARVIQLTYLETCKCTHQQQ